MSIVECNICTLIYIKMCNFSCNKNGGNVYKGN